ncbi:hypothetical protein CFOL_v3_11410 [Cephalotus follicularis]|uniref:Uncharacterized protein n=1 Tax=Cephalotus follicularis TaxID=3775 RepID=A0A1Q3BIR9_CEPFO|nr:hypothetical protein CFOL_v3_11410 [Cephalotus follicularis]
MDFLFNGMDGDTFECLFDVKDIQRCPFLRSINKPASFSLSPINFPTSTLVRGAKGPILEDGPNLDMAFKLFHGKDGVVPLSGRSYFHIDNQEPEPAPSLIP